MTKWLAILMIFLVPGSAAQIAWGDPLLEDGAGDVAFNAADSGQPIAGHDAIDVRALWVHEDPFDIHFMIQVEDLEGAATSGGTTSALFTLGEWRYRVQMLRTFDSEEGFFGSLSRNHVEDGRYEYIQQLMVFGNVDQDLLWTSVGRDLLTSGSSLKAGTPLRDFVAEGINLWFGAAGQQARAYDAAPDAGPGPVRELTMNRNVANGLSLSAPEPFRASNGEATTYQYMVTARNSGDETIAAPVSMENVPNGWNASIPGSYLTLEPRQSFQFPVTVTVPFAHEHGATQSLELVIGEPENPLALQELGVHYLATPQPAGHHATVFFHTHPWSGAAGIINPPLGGANGYVSFNTLQEDPADTGTPITPFANAFDQTRYVWNMCLSPELSMGLEWDMENPGSTEFTIATQAPISGATITGEFALVDAEQVNFYCAYFGSDRQEVARFTQELGDLNGLSSVGVNAEVHALVDRVEYDPTKQLVLRIALEGPTPMPTASGAPEMLSGGSITLPLFEYHDAVSVASPLLDNPDNGATPALSEPAPEVKESPGGLVIGLVALAAAACTRRWQRF